MPTLMVIRGSGTNFQAFQSQVTFSPAVIGTPVLVLGKETILRLILVNPSWLVGGATDGILTVTVTTGSESVSGTVNVQMLPFGLDK